jgi:hypothetical protein
MWRRHFHRHPDLRFEGCRLPGKLGIRERFGAMTGWPAVPWSSKSRSQSGQRLPTTGAMSTTHSARPASGLAPRPLVPRRCPLPLEGLRGRGIGLDRPLGGRGHRAEKALCGVPLLVAELLPEALECLGEPIDLPRLFQSFCTPIQGHLRSRRGTGCEAPCCSRHSPRGMVERGQLKKKLQGARQGSPGDHRR